MHSSLLPPPLCPATTCECTRVCVSVCMCELSWTLLDRVMRDVGQAFISSLVLHSLQDPARKVEAVQRACALLGGKLRRCSSFISFSFLFLSCASFFPVLVAVCRRSGNPGLDPGRLHGGAAT